MGQCYFVDAYVKFKNDDPSSFCEVIKKEIETRIEKEEAVFDLDGRDLNDPYGCFEVLCPNSYKDSEGGWHSGFDACYGWETVMVEIFSEAAKVLDDGSVIDISPDFALHHITVKDGKVTDTFSDPAWYEEEEEDDDR